MRDVFFVLFLIFLLGLGFGRPYLATLAYLWVDLLQPQQQSYYLINSVPISMIAAVFAVFVYVVADKEKVFRVNIVQVMLAFMIFLITMTTISADVGEAAWFKWSAGWKALGFAIFLPLVIRTRLQIETTLLVIMFTVCALMFAGAFKTILGGGGYGHMSFLVDRDVGLFEASTLATVAVGMIPFALYLYRHGTLFAQNRWSLLVCIGVMASALLVVVGAEARTGLIAVAAVAILEWRHVKRKILTAVLGSVIFLAALPFLPQSFTGRMGTIKTYDEDTSASTRVAMWKWTWDYVKQHPLGGGFEVWKRSQIVYEVRTRSEAGREGRQQIKDEARGFHSSFFEMLGEQGFLGLILFLSIFGATIGQLYALTRRFRNDPENQWIVGCANALISFICVYMIGSAFQALAFQSTAYHMIALSVALINIGAAQRLAAKQAAGTIRPGQFATAGARRL